MNRTVDAYRRTRTEGSRPLLRWAAVTIAAAVAVLLLLPAPIFAQAAAIVPLPSMTEGWTRVVTGGFTDPGNSHVIFSTEFRGYYYVSTMAGEAGRLIAGSDKQGGDIWRTADGITWEQIGTAGLGDPTNIMFDLVVFREQLYALSINVGGRGMEVWVTSDGTRFTKLGERGFGDPKNRAAVPTVLDGRLVLAVQNPDTGVQIWVSEDGSSFRQVPVDGLCVPGNIGLVRSSRPEDPGPLLGGKLYVGVTNSTTGGEIWRTVDGLEWEQVADRGLGLAQRNSLRPLLVYKDQLYVVGGHLAWAAGFDLFRSGDGTGWEQVVEDGFGAGEHRNYQADLVEFEGRLYLSTQNEEPRLFVPGSSTERFTTQGFQLWASADGSDWTQVGEDGFGRSTSYMSDIAVWGGKLYLQAVDYRAGSQLWQSEDGQEWTMIFHEPPRSFFHIGPGLHVFDGHCLYVSHDMEKGLDIWRSDEAIVAGTPTTVTPDESTTSTAPGGGGAGAAAGDGEDGSGAGGGADSETAGGATSQGLSGGILALIIALAIVAAAGVGAFLYLLGRSRAGKHVPPALSTTPPSSAPGFCPQCGAGVAPGSQYCPGCGKEL
ncbi:MAG: zinc ribbon domain-containing protein [Actinobacteria bacterium]|nr:zinc ribbon domain-containing protein [Actinomycetota bacterium]